MLMRPARLDGVSSDPQRGPGRRERPDEKQEAPARSGQHLHGIQTYVEQSIRQAQRRGDFDDLPGAGKPLPGLERPHDPDWWAKQLVERERIDLSEALPPPVALRREKAGFPESLADLTDEALVRERLHDFNSRVLQERRRPWFGATSPPVVGRVDVEGQVAAWRRLREAGAPERAGTARPEARTGQPGVVEPGPGGHTGRPRRDRLRWWRRGNRSQDR